MISERKQKQCYFRESQVWRILIETLNALKSVHALGVVHRDLKSANILMSKPGWDAAVDKEDDDETSLYQAMVSHFSFAQVLTDEVN